MLNRFARNIIAVHRRSGPVKYLHRVASFVESAYSNEGSNFEFDGERAVLQKLRPADFRIAIDAGANFGDWSAEALTAWPGCEIHAFEVAPQTFERLTDRFRSSAHSKRIALNCFGVSDKSGTSEMYYYPDHPEQTCDTHRHPKDRAERFETQLITGDEYCDSRRIDAVDFLKIDVEGAEFRVIQGLSRRLAAQKIHCLQFEYGAFSTQTKFLLGDYYSLLAQSYWIGKIFPSYVDFRDYHWTMDNFRFCNYCCVSKLRPDLRKLLEA